MIAKFYFFSLKQYRKTRILTIIFFLQYQEKSRGKNLKRHRNIDVNKKERTNQNKN